MICVGFLQNCAVMYDARIMKCELLELLVKVRTYIRHATTRADNICLNPDIFLPIFETAAGQVVQF